MRLGILTFGAAPDTTLLDALGDRDVDVVRGEATVSGLAGAKAEAERVARADCDGVALVIGDDAQALHVAHAAQFLGVTQLLVGRHSDAFFAACGALAEVGIPFDRALFAAGETATTDLWQWLQSNRKAARQAGVDVAQKIYGQTLRVVGVTTVGVDAAQWRQQFGISIVFGSGNTATDEVDLVADDGNPNRALCRRLLHLVSGQDAAEYCYGDAFPVQTTLAQLYRSKGKFHLLCFYHEDAGQTIGADLSVLFDAVLYSVPGDVRPALRAACDSLDIVLG